MKPILKSNTRLIEALITFYDEPELGETLGVLVGKSRDKALKKLDELIDRL